MEPKERQDSNTDAKTKDSKEEEADDDEEKSMRAGSRANVPGANSPVSCPQLCHGYWGLSACLTVGTDTVKLGTHRVPPIFGNCTHCSWAAGPSRNCGIWCRAMVSSYWGMDCGLREACKGHVAHPWPSQVKQSCYPPISMIRETGKEERQKRPRVFFTSGCPCSCWTPRWEGRLHGFLFLWNNPEKAFSQSLLCGLSLWFSVSISHMEALKSARRPRGCVTLGESHSLAVFSHVNRKWRWWVIASRRQETELVSWCRPCRLEGLWLYDMHGEIAQRQELGHVCRGQS